MSFRSKRSVGLRVACALVLPALSITVFTSRASAGTHTVPASIDPTGKSDVTDELNAFIETVPDGSTVAFPADATYRSEGVFSVEERRDLVLDFNGARLIANTDGSGVDPHHLLPRYWPRHRAHLYIYESTGIEVRDLVVRGPHARGGTGDDAWQPGLEAQHAIEVSGSDDVSVQGCDVSRIFGDGVYIGRSSERVRVSDCEIHHNGRQGIAVTSARDIVLENNHLHDIRRTAFDLEPHPNTSLENITIRNNHVESTRLHFVSGHGSGKTFTGIRILDNLVDTSSMKVAMKAQEDTRRGSIEVRGNTNTKTFGSRAALINISGYDEVTVVDNTADFDGRDGGVAVTVLEACVTDIRNNKFTNVEQQQEVTLANSACAGRSDGPQSSSPVIRIGNAHSVERSSR